MPKKTKRMVYGGPSEELRLDMRGYKLVFPKGVAKMVSDAEYEYLKRCQKKLNITPVEEWEDSHKKKLRERILKE